MGARIEIRSPNWRSRIALALAALAAYAGSARAQAPIAGVGLRSILEFPKVVATEQQDTLLRIANSSNNAVFAHCFYVDAQRVLADQPPGPLNPPLLIETDFFIQLTRQQPTHWVASRGRLPDDTDQPCAPGVLACDGAGNDPGKRQVDGGPQSAAVPPVPLGFTGELTCVESDGSGNPIGGNHLSGTAILNNRATGAVAEYAAVGLEGTEVAGATGPRLELSGEQYARCPTSWSINQVADGATDPLAGPESSISTELTVVACSRSYEDQLFASLTFQLIVTNEMEESFSAAHAIDYWETFRLTDVGEFLTRATLGTDHARVQLRSRAGGVFVVAHETRGTGGSQPLYAAAASNPHFQDEQVAADVIQLPSSQ